MKAFIVALAPIALLIWFVLCCCYGVLKGTIIALVYFVLVALLVWWVLFAVKKFG